MSDLLFTGLGDDAHDASVLVRAALHDTMDGPARRMDRSGVPLRWIAERVYTCDLRGDPAAIVRRHAWTILGTLMPGHVISARSAVTATPTTCSDRSWAFLTGPGKDLALPGLQVHVEAGPGPQQGDIPFLGLYLASPARHCLENLGMPVPGDGPRRVTGREGVEAFLCDQWDIGGDERLVALLDQARVIAPGLRAERQVPALERTIRALLRSGDREDIVSRRARSLASGLPYDPVCMARLEALRAFLTSHAMPRRPVARRDHADDNNAFLEAYFSNLIEGVEFTVAEARDIVDGGDAPEGREADAAELLSTFRQATDGASTRRLSGHPGNFVGELRARHAELTWRRKSVRPGQLKEEWNRAGNHVFVAPGLVRGTLMAGHSLLQGLDDPFARALLIHYLVAEVHPFDDGNGRLARIAMGCELGAGGLARAVIPPVFRDDYIAGMRVMSNRTDCGANFRAIDRAQEVTASIGEADRDRCIERWATTFAFCWPGRNARLTDADPALPVEWRGGRPAPASYWEAENQDCPMPGF